MRTRDELLAGIVADPLEETRWLVLADWLEERDDPRRAELLRLHRRLLATCLEPDAHAERMVWQTRVSALLAAGVEPCVPRQPLVLPGGVPLDGAFVPPGRFRMGSDHPDGYRRERPVHQVTLTRGFFMGVFPVTQVQWQAVMGTDPSHFKGPNRPVEQVSWHECQQFCSTLTANLGKGCTVRLPTEAEWEWACRAGTTTEFHYGETISTDLANYDGNGSWNGSPEGVNREATTDVGAFPANPWGLRDLHGNVWEWCADLYTHYTSDDQDQSRVNSARSDDDDRVLRGGSWRYFPLNCRAACRRRNAPVNRSGSIGFRVCFCLD